MMVRRTGTGIAVLLLLGAVLAAAVHVVSGWVAGYDPLLVPLATSLVVAVFVTTAGATVLLALGGSFRSSPRPAPATPGSGSSGPVKPERREREAARPAKSRAARCWRPELAPER